METKQIVVRAVPVDLWKQFKIRAVQDNRTIQDALVKALETYLNQAA
jgi:hypothetical protein